MTNDSDNEKSKEIRREWLETIELWEKTAAERSTDPKVSPEKLELIKQGIKKWMTLKKEIENGYTPPERPARGYRRGEDGEWRASTDEESDELEASFNNPEDEWIFTTEDLGNDVELPKRKRAMRESRKQRLF